MGPPGRLGFGRQRRIRSADLGVAKGRADDELERAVVERSAFNAITKGKRRVMTLSKPILFLSAAMTASAALVAIVSTSAVIVAGGTTPIPADALACDLAQYKASPGLTAAMDQNVLTVAWSGRNGS